MPTTTPTTTRPVQFLHTFPYGATAEEDGVQFAVFSRNATAVRVLLYDSVDDREPTEIIECDAEHGRHGDMWTLFVGGIGPGQLYHFQVDGPHEPENGHRFDGTARLIDPYAEALAGDYLPATDGIVRPPKCVVVDGHFDWNGDRQLKRPLSETVIYEMHVRGFTQDDSSGVDHPGTYRGIVEKIPYLKELGVTAVELMPVQGFAHRNSDGMTNLRHNYWGYDPIAWFAPHHMYAADQTPGAVVREFKEMVRQLHAAGIEVILDVVFNHTAEGNELGPTYGFKGLENSVYYLLENDKRYYRNYSGCGNTVNGNHPVVREMIFHCLRNWVLNYHIDGFRFDLASILSRDRHGNLVPNTPAVEAIAEDPLLADTKLIAEAWDAAGAYQVGSFSHIRWAEWNGRYRDEVREFWNGFQHSCGPAATRLSGSSDLYQSSGREPFHGINFVTAHDGFTMNDLVSYERKHNEANGEGNRDGENHNASVNFGMEGPTEVAGIERNRLRQIKNLLATLMLSQGVPMMLYGDECRRTQNGNNNSYCQDNELSWFDWSLVEEHSELVRFTSKLIAFRKANSTLRREEFLSGVLRPGSRLPDVSWYNADGRPMNWELDTRSVVMLLGHDHSLDDGGTDVMLLIHAGSNTRTFTLPEILVPREWRLVIDTAASSPRDFHDGDGPPLSRRSLSLVGRSLMAFVRTEKDTPEELDSLATPTSSANRPKSGT